MKQVQVRRMLLRRELTWRAVGKGGKTGAEAGLVAATGVGEGVLVCKTWGIAITGDWTTTFWGDGVGVGTGAMAALFCSDLPATKTPVTTAETTIRATAAAPMSTMV
jgi:hypothetical protein